MAEDDKPVFNLGNWLASLFSPSGQGGFSLAELFKPTVQSSRDTSGTEPRHSTEPSLDVVWAKATHGQGGEVPNWLRTGNFQEYKQSLLAGVSFDDQLNAVIAKNEREMIQSLSPEDRAAVVVNGKIDLAKTTARTAELQASGDRLIAEGQTASPEMKAVVMKVLKEHAPAVYAQIQHDGVKDPLVTSAGAPQGASADTKRGLS